MKNIFTIICLIGFSLQINGQKKLKVVSSASMFYDMAQNISGDLMDHDLIVPIGGDPHTYEPRPSDAKLIAEADLILINGLEFEGWMLKLIENSGSKAIVDTITLGIKPISHSEYADAYDPHAWMDVNLGLQYIENIKDAFIKLDPENKDAYIQNHKTYHQKLEELDKYIKVRIKEIPAKNRIIITTHDAFAYYGKRYGLKLEALMGISTETDATSQDMIRVSKAIKNFNVPALFVESTINPKIVQQIASDNNVAIGGELFTDSMGGPESKGNTYYNMMKHNTDTVVDALKGEKFAETKFKSETKGTNPMVYVAFGVSLLLLLIPIILKLNK
jgi:ABC-type Zn uptake system ZnuABC Zn-binding protein ZnuA